jgi:hypothetical protein
MAKKRKVSSALGETVDFDLMRVKQNIENRDKPDGVEMREKYIDIRRRRNPRRNVADLVTEQRSNETDARDKIQQSKKNKQEALAKLESEAKLEAPTDITVEDVVDTTVSTEKPDDTEILQASPKKKIVKRTQPEENSDK